MAYFLFFQTKPAYMPRWGMNRYLIKCYSIGVERGAASGSSPSDLPVRPGHVSYAKPLIPALRESPPTVPAAGPGENVFRYFSLHAFWSLAKSTIMTGLGSSWYGIWPSLVCASKRLIKYKLNRAVLRHKYPSQWAHCFLIHLQWNYPFHLHLTHLATLHKIDSSFCPNENATCARYGHDGLDLFQTLPRSSLQMLQNPL